MQIEGHIKVEQLIQLFFSMDVVLFAQVFIARMAYSSQLMRVLSHFLLMVVHSFMDAHGKISVAFLIRIKNISLINSSSKLMNKLIIKITIKHNC